MRFRFIYSIQAYEDLASLEIKESKRINDKLEHFVQQPNPFKFAKSLQGKHIGLYRFRIGNYRAIFSKDAAGVITVLTILTIKHRRDVYK